MEELINYFLCLPTIPNAEIAFAIKEDFLLD